MSRSRKPNRSRRRPPSRPSREETIIVERLGRSGDGLTGKISIPFGLPGEEMRVRIEGNNAAPIEILQPSPVREDPVCAHFGLPGDGCGGCQLQHLGAGGLLDWKKDRLMSYLSATGIELPDIQVFQSAGKTRRRAKLALEKLKGKWRIGFRQKRSHALVPFTECHVLRPEILTAAHQLRDHASSLIGAAANIEVFMTLTDTGLDMDVLGIDEMSLDLPQREAWAQYTADNKLARLTIGGIGVASPATPQIILDEVPVGLHPGGFLQATADGQNFMQSKIVDATKHAKTAADLFCGSGTFALPMSRYATVTAVDSEGEAIDQLHLAAGRAQRAVVAERRDLFQDPLTAKELNIFDAVVFDPPRAGAKEQSAEIAKSDVKTVVAVSCNPETLSRDLEQLSDCYNLAQLFLVDQFLWTPHIETIAVLHRRS